MSASEQTTEMSGGRVASVIAAVCLCQILGMATYATFPTLLAVFRADWGLGDAAMGWISGSYFAGVALSTLVLPSMTDRWSAKRIYLAAVVVSVVSALGFALAAGGLWSASLWRFLQGIGLGGTYLPGLRALLRTLPANHHGRATAFYTSTFYVGASLSYFAAGALETRLGWQNAFAWSALGPVLAFVLAAVVLKPGPPQRVSSSYRILDFRPLLRNRAALGYTIAYGVHNAELLVVHSWLVAFLAFSQSLQSPGVTGGAWAAATIVAVINLAALPASIGTNELATRFGHVRTIGCIMLAAGVVGIGMAASAAAWFPLVLVLGFLLLVAVSADSAALTNGLRAAVPEATLGRALSLYSATGFLAGTLSPVLFGAVLDGGGGAGQQGAWLGAHGVIAVIFLAGPLALLRLVREGAPASPRKGRDSA